MPHVTMCTPSTRPGAGFVDDILAECRSLGNDVAIATCHHEKIANSGGHRYREARKPELYGPILAAEHRSEQKVASIP